MPGQDHVGTPTPGVKLTYDDLLLMPDDGLRHELIDGEHYVSPSPTVRHQRVQRRLLALTSNWLDTHPIGEVFVAELDVVLSSIDIVQPDLLYISNERRAIITQQNVQGVPELVIEIGSPSTRRHNETTKRRLYEREGVTEYWFVDPDIEVIRVYRHSGQAFDRPIELSRDAGDVLTTQLLPGLQIPLVEVFKDPTA